MPKVEPSEPSLWDKIWYLTLNWVVENVGYLYCPQMYYPHHVMPQEYREYTPYFPGNYRSFPIF